MKNIFFIILLAVIITATTSSCRKDPVITDASAKLVFSQDTILFDTVFTTVGSSTHWLQVYNNHKKKIIISSIRLAGGNSSMFRINVDGKAAKEFSDVEIAGKDSLFIFVEVTVDPVNQNTPMILTDSIIFETNGNIQDVDLAAWGQDAYFHTPVKGTILSPLHFCNEVWTKEKPHVIYGYFFVDSSCTLTINEGVRVYIHNGSGILVYKDGSLKINGTYPEPVRIQGDRLESVYQEIPGQWDRIWLYPGSINNEVDYAVIKNGNVGFMSDTTGNSTNPTLTLSNTVIQNMAGAGLYAQGSFVVAVNSIFANCGIHNVLLSIGGDYSFRHCTFANFWNHDTRQTPLLGLNNYYEDVNHVIQARNLSKAYFGNCIMFGALEKEIALDYKTTAEFNYLFDNCLLKSDSVLDAEQILFPARFSNNLISNKTNNNDPLFTDPAQNDYSLGTGSPAIDKGSLVITNTPVPLPLDIKQKSRTSDAAPDLGAIEK